MAAVLMTTLLSAAMAPSWLGRAPAALRVPAIVSRGRPASMDLPNIDGTGAFRDVQVRSRFRLFFTAAVFFISRYLFPSGWTRELAWSPLLCSVRRSIHASWTSR